MIRGLPSFFSSSSSWRGEVDCAISACTRVFDALWRNPEGVNFLATCHPTPPASRSSPPHPGWGWLDREAGGVW
jgi:hypothetical protein